MWGWLRCRIRYIGVTTTSSLRYEELTQVMRNEPLDFSGIDYAIDNRNVEDSILPLAAERQVGVLRKNVERHSAQRELLIGQALQHPLAEEPRDLPGARPRRRVRSPGERQPK